MYLNIGTGMVLKDFKISRIDNVDLEMTVDEFKTKVAEKINFLKENIDVTFAGLILEDATTLKENGLQEGFVVNVLQKKEKYSCPTATAIVESDIPELVRAFQILATRNAHRRVLQKLNKPEVLENIISTTPGLVDDDIAIVILQHPELIARLGDVNAVQKVIEEHPSLALAARNLLAAVQCEVLTSPSASTSSAPSLNNITFLGASDDEDVENWLNMINDTQNRTTSEASEEGEHPVNVITSSQVAAALASTTAASRSNITPEMMSAAVQQAIASTSSQSSSSTPEENTDESVTISKLEQLRKLGFVNDAVNIQALQLASGNVEAAVNLILSGLHEEN